MFASAIAVIMTVVVATTITIAIVRMIADVITTVVTVIIAVIVTFRKHGEEIVRIPEVSMILPLLPSEVIVAATINRLQTVILA